MGTIKMNRAKSAAAAISYALGRNRMKSETKEWLIEHGCPPGALKNNDRAVVRSGINISPTYANAEMKAVRQHANGDTVKNQAIRIIQSFAADDLDITKPENWQICNEIGYEFARRAFGGLDDENEEGYYPPYQIAIYTHVDGKGHKLHNHIIINKTNLHDGKQWTVENLDQEWRSFREINDSVCREYGLKITQERSKKVKKTISERELEMKGKYVWKNDLRARIDGALAELKKENINLEEALKARGVDVRRRGQNGISYAFVDNEGKKRISRGQRLGTNYERESVDEYEQEVKRQREQAQRAREAARSVRHDVRRSTIDAVQNYQQQLEQSIGASRERVKRVGERKRAIIKLVRSLQQAIDRSIALMKRLRADFERRKAEMKRFQAKIWKMDSIKSYQDLERQMRLAAEAADQSKKTAPKAIVAVTLRDGLPENSSNPLIAATADMTRYLVMIDQGTWSGGQFEFSGREKKALANATPVQLQKINGIAKRQAKRLSGIVDEAVEQQKKNAERLRAKNQGKRYRR
ncbi:relaxase/mobilization nuclease domain-containing protein [Limosilactobacillus mucosae]|uniref:relaxase/mobilization nuclease domain-containing protein n=1 Tax=Limosilactobacillus mucosae TaxID=97478 RepID=UPI0022E6604D|nr:relaxase/mobilization nuclease domain-containing protein [Limosilactobacillus mucosae]